MSRARRAWLVGLAVAVLVAALVGIRPRGNGRRDGSESAIDAASLGGAVGATPPSSSQVAPLAPGPRANGPAGTPRDGADASAPRDLRPFVGRVLDEDREPVAKAVVTVFDVDASGRGVAGAPHVISTDESGGFSVDAPELDGPCLVTASAPGRATNGTATLRRGVRVELVLVAAGDVRVLAVEKESNRPVSGAKVHLYGGADAEGSWAYLLGADPTAIGTTDALGVATLHAPLGHARVAVVASDLAPAISAIFPVGSKGCDVRLVLLAGSSIAGTVRDERGTPIPGAEVVAVIPGLERRSIFAAADGGYEIHGLAGVAADLGEFDPPRLEGRAFEFATGVVALPELAPGTRHRLDVTLSRARVVTVRVVGPDGGPPPGGLHLRELFRHSIHVGGDTWIESEEIDLPLVEGSVVLSDIGPDFAGVRIAQPGGTGDFGQFTLPPTGDEWTIRLPTRTLTPVRVRVESSVGSPVVGADVELVDPHASWGPLARGVTDADGRAAVSVALPAALLVRVRVPNAPPLHQRAVVREGAPVDVTVLVPAGRIVGRLVSSDGSPVEGEIRLDASLDVGHSPYAAVSTGPAGRFAFEGLAPGEYRLRSSDADGRVEGTSVRARPGEDSVTLRLPRVGEREAWTPRLRLVDDATGDPVGGNGGESLTLTRGEGTRTVTVEPVVDRTATGLLVSRDAVEPGVWRADVLVAGWAPGRIDRLVLPMGDEEPVLRLRRGATLRGKFVDTAGRPFHPADVDLVGGHSTWTSSDGEFELDGVPPGPVELELSSEATGLVRVRATAPAEGSFDVVATAARRGSIAIGFDVVPEVSLALRVVAVGSGAVTSPARRQIGRAHV